MVGEPISASSTAPKASPRQRAVRASVGATEGVRRFAAKVHLVGINTYVDVPDLIIGDLRESSGNTTGPLRVRARLAATPFRTTIVRYAGRWRL
jgi:hypothetical protein